MYVARSIVSILIKLPVCAIVPIRGGREPTMAPTNVFHGLDYFIGKYMHK